MKLAASQIAWAPPDERGALAILKENGFAGLEVAPARVTGPEPYESPAEAAVFAAAVAEEYGLAVCSLQGLWWGLLGSIFGAGREDISQATRGAIRFAKATGAGNLVIGGPAQRVIPAEMDRAEAEEGAVNLFREWAGYAALHDCRLGLEALPTSFPTNFINATEDAFTIASRVDSPGCGVNLDTATMLVGGEAPDILRGRVDAISHVHVSEPDGRALSRWDWHAQLAAVLREEGYTGYVSIEMGQQPLEALKAVAARFAGVFG